MPTDRRHYLPFYADIGFRALEQVEDALRNDPVTFKVAVQVQAEYVRLRKVGVGVIFTPEAAHFSSRTLHWICP